MTCLTKLTAVLLVVASPALAQSDEQEKLRQMSANAIASITGVAPSSARVETGAGADALQQIVQQAVAQGQSDAYLEALLEEAVQKGEIQVDDAMRTTDGDIDTSVLLASLVAKSTALSDPSATAAINPDAVVPVTEAAVVLEDRYYVVKSGDSLAAISVAYYDSALQYDRIFQANRDVLSSPDRIRVGQRLIIPR